MSLASLSSDSQRIERVHEYACDALAVSGGWSPNLHLYAQAGGKLQFNPATHALSPVTSGAFWPATRYPSIELAGSVARPALSEIGPRICPVGKTHRHFVDLRHDVTFADLELAVREGFTSMEHIKRYTTLGMAADQGKTSNLAGLETGLRGLEPSQVGHTTFRPPFVPVTLGAIAARAIGPRFAPMRLLPMHDWHVAHGAIMQNCSGWKRPVAYLRAGESRPAAVLREMRTVRTEVGLLDYSPLGKIEVRGPDALDFLNRFCISDLTTLKPIACATASCSASRASSSMTGPSSCSPRIISSSRRLPVTPNAWRPGSRNGISASGRISKLRSFRSPKPGRACRAARARC